MDSEVDKQNILVSHVFGTAHHKINTGLKNVMIQGKQNVITFSSKRKSYTTTLEYKAGAYEAIVKVLDQHGQCFGYLSGKCTGISTEKLKSGTSDGPQIRAY